MEQVLKNQESKAIVAKAVNDWNWFIEKIGGANLDKDQKRIINAIQHEPRVSVRSGTSRGKDYAAAWASFCFFALTPKFRYNSEGKKELIEATKVAMTAPTDRQIKNIMYPEITKIYRAIDKKMPLLTRPFDWRLVSYDIRTEFEDWFLTGFKADNNNIEAWSGFHAPNVMFVITEASGMAEQIFESIEGCLQGNSRILLVFNPNVATGYAAQSTKKENWKKIKLNSLYSPNVIEKKIIIPGQVDYEWLLDKIQNMCERIDEKSKTVEKNDFEFEGKWYRPNDWFRIKVLGEFAEVPENVLVPRGWIEAANERWKNFVEEKRLIKGNLIVGTDVAGMGADDTVLLGRVNDFVSFIEQSNAHGKANHMETVGKLKNRLNTPLDAGVIDTIGEGAGVYSRAMELGMNVYSYKSNEGAKGLTDVHGVYSFRTMRDYAYWAVRDWLNPANNSQACLPQNAYLLEELSETRWSYDSNGRPSIEVKDKIKERIKRSPDVADALSMTFFPKDRMVDNFINNLKLSYMI